jgi:hypothetical protein
MAATGAASAACASLAREDMIALFVEQLEMEIVAFPEKVTIEAVEHADLADARVF